MLEIRGTEIASFGPMEKIKILAFALWMTGFCGWPAQAIEVAQKPSLSFPSAVTFPKDFNLSLQQTPKIKEGAASAREGVNHGGGGDAVLADMVAVWEYIYKNGGNWPELSAAKVKFETLRQTMDSVKSHGRLYVVDKLNNQGHENVAMVADSENLSLAVNRRFWLSLDNLLAKKITALVHGLLWLQGVEKFNNFKFSSDISYNFSWKGRTREVLQARPILSPNLFLSSFETPIQPDQTKFDPTF